jgi:hypothetical protein
MSELPFYFKLYYNHDKVHDLVDYSVQSNAYVMHTFDVPLVILHSAIFS